MLHAAHCSTPLLPSASTRVATDSCWASRWRPTPRMLHDAVGGKLHQALAELAKFSEHISSRIKQHDGLPIGLQLVGRWHADAVDLAASGSNSSANVRNPLRSCATHATHATHAACATPQWPAFRELVAPAGCRRDQERRRQAYVWQPV
jgi:hypothetical protein